LRESEEEAVETYAEILQRLATKRTRRLVPEELVEEARDSEHPLHDYFNWDDKSAAHAHRVDQARQLICRIKVTVTEEFDLVPGGKVPMYVRDPEADADEQGSIALPVVLSNEEKSRRVLDYELTRLRGWLERVQAMAIAFGDVTPFNDLLREFTVRQRRESA
jgi:hypothetical protein